MRIFFINGNYVPEADAQIPVMDRGFLMGDAIYEVIAVLDGKLLDFEGHWLRLVRSLGELKIDNPFDRDSFLDAFKEMVARNTLEEGSVYLQITRGVAERDFAIAEKMRPTVVMFTQERQLRKNPTAQKGMKIITRPDLRWQRGDIKTTQLLYASLMKTEAMREGKDDCWMVRDGFITEGTSNNAFILNENDEIITRPPSSDILAGITRASVLKICETRNLRLVERAFTLEEAQNAKEAFISSAGALIVPVVEIDGVQIADGKAGEVAKSLREIYIETALVAAI